jgi:hypothetical protein
MKPLRKSKFIYKEYRTEKCVRCGTQFSPVKLEKYCSIECREGKTFAPEEKDIPRNCLICGTRFPSRRYPNKRYCSKECYKKATPNRNPLSKFVPTKNMGAYSELAVILDLFRKGYEVYRAVSSHCSGDIIAEKNGKLIKIDATTGMMNSNGSYSFPGKETDVIVAVYLTDQEKVVYLQNKKEVEV